MDVLSEVLHAVRLTGALYFEVAAARPWIAQNPSMREIGAAMMPGAEHVIPFHIMISGCAWAMPEDRSVSPTRIDSGDVVMFPSGQSHVISSDRDSWDAPPADLRVYFDAAESDAPFTLLSIGGAGEKSRFVCGYLGCLATPFNPLLRALPRMLAVAAGMNTDSLMREILHSALGGRETQGAGAQTVLAKLSELMFVHSVQQYMSDLPETSFNWLSGLRDAYVGRALHLIHSKPAEDWSIERLARESGLSRSTFADRFARYAGEPPMQYLGRWRMQLAAGLLESGARMGDVAERVGYSSEAAFQRAFKKFVGTTPGRWRRRSAPGRWRRRSGPSSDAAGP